MQKERISGERIFVIHDFLSPGECDAHIGAGEAVGFEEATISLPRGPEMRKEIRNNTRVILDAPRLAEELFERARPYLPERIDNWQFAGLNERFRYYRYDPGQTFRPHLDGSFRRTDRERSLLTFMVYLNDGFSGGSTVFHSRTGEDLEVVPCEGMALVFEHPQLHEGAPVLSGRKYVLRTDVMYTLRSSGDDV